MTGCSPAQDFQCLPGYAVLLLLPIHRTWCPTTRIDEVIVDISVDGILNELVCKVIPVIDDIKVINRYTLADASLETHTRIYYT